MLAPRVVVEVDAVALHAELHVEPGVQHEAVPELVEVIRRTRRLRKPAVGLVEEVDQLRRHLFHALDGRVAFHAVIVAHQLWHFGLEGAHMFGGGSGHCAPTFLREKDHFRLTMSRK